MRIEVWSDFVCPFCYIGKRHLEEALAQFPERDQIEVVYKSFELDPEAERNTSQSMHEKLAAKYGRSIDEAKQMTANMRQQASAVGLNFQFDTMVPTNTFDAHRVAKFAETQGLGKEITERFLKAVFTESKDIGDHQTITELSAEVGLDREEVQQVLENSSYEETVRSEETEAGEVGLQGVPLFILNRKYAISGAQPTEVFVKGIEKIIAEEKETPLFEDLSSSQGTACTGDGCEIPATDSN